MSSWGPRPLYGSVQHHHRGCPWPGPTAVPGAHLSPGRVLEEVRGCVSEGCPGGSGSWGQGLQWEVLHPLDPGSSLGAGLPLPRHPLPPSAARQNSVAPWHLGAWTPLCVWSPHRCFPKARPGLCVHEFSPGPHGSQPCSHKSTYMVRGSVSPGGHKIPSWVRKREIKEKKEGVREGVGPSPLQGAPCKASLAPQTPWAVGGLPALPWAPWAWFPASEKIPRS